MADDIIHLLPDSVANQIAAGEVIQRPASVVKELVENAVDAGATSIDIIIKDAGRTLIQVVDNGSGMSMTDARMAFERHATSKISQATDLFSLHTMGFRGEALPSIAAVSEIDLRSMRRSDPSGTRIIITASKVESQTPEACVPGTNIMVKRLFFNLPARRKFLKKDSVELGHIIREFERMALVNTSLAFTLTHNDVLLHQLLPSSLKQRIGALFGKTLEHGIIPISAETSLAEINGFISLPQNCRRRGAQQFFFVNGRNMRHPYFHKAVLSCYQELIASDTQPNYFINFTVDPQTIDVNIHPQKHEIKFENEQPIWQILTAAVKEALGRYNAAPSIDFDRDNAPDIPVLIQGRSDTEMPGIDIDPNYNPFSTQAPVHQSQSSRAQYGISSRMNSRTAVSSDWQKLYENFSRGTDAAPDAPTPAENTAPTSAPALDITSEEKTWSFQLKNRYIITPSRSGLMIIDQHRAHVRVLYEKYLDRLTGGDMPSQRLIFPDTVTLDPDSEIILSAILPQMAASGFDFANLGNRTWAINAAPATLGKLRPAEAVLDIIQSVAEDAGQEFDTAQWQKVALALARSSAIRSGAQLSGEEIENLISDLFRLPTPNYTPDGLTVLRLLDLNSISDLF